jgi:hypothetical protein
MVEWADLYEIERMRFLHFFLPKNFSRVHPLAYVFVAALALFIFGIWIGGLISFFAPIGLFVLVLFGLYFCFWKWPLI